MSLYTKKTTGTVYKPVFLKILEDYPGGVTIATNRVPSDVKVLEEGLPLAQSSNTTGLYQFLKTARPVNSLNTAGTVLRVESNHLFKVGDYIAKVGNEASGSTITRIESQSSTINGYYYDEVATARDAGTLVNTQRLVELNAVGATTRAYYADTILKDTIRVREDDLTTLYNVHASIVVRGSVDESALPYYVTSQDKTQLTDRLWFA